MRNICKAKLEFKLYSIFLVSFHGKMKKLILLIPQENCIQQGLSAENKIILNISERNFINLLSVNRKFNGHTRDCILNFVVSYTFLACYLFSQWFSMKRNNHTQNYRTGNNWFYAGHILLIPGNCTTANHHILEIQTGV